ncbi:hypothetical protein Afil01_52040 [Actinorhabdospora filicis]|uniref:non-specific serine/threonine protein kinase n=1 Tax=Actinorhabdospora filicis TaxID=1785913 RepID=A0A9W6SQN3_9ACTN|nr:serine/threonine protein kinase [Actinorhabdospora filicis]GLZ80397.1 hypothetical protein Afil01_52040 [Actinorhabdospora filicis]
MSAQFWSPGAGDVPDLPDLTDLRVIARGGYTTVYRAHQVSGGREVALRIDKRPFAQPEQRARFEQEVRAAGRLSGHPNVVDLFAAGVTDDGRPYVVMELCEGSYADRLDAEGSISDAEVKDIGMQLADALAGAHERGVLHRDIKPANILIRRDGRPVLADFGLAVVTDAALRTDGATIGHLTPAYAPLETLQMKPASQFSDVYSLAATLYALLAGHPPRFSSDITDLREVMELFGRPIPDVTGASALLVGMLRAAMTSNPDGRPTAEQFREMLDSVPLAKPTAPPQRPSPRPPAQGDFPIPEAREVPEPSGAFRSPAEAATAVFPVAAASPEPSGGFARPEPTGPFRTPEPPGPAAPPEPSGPFRIPEPRPDVHEPSGSFRSPAPPAVPEPSGGFRSPVAPPPEPSGGFARPDVHEPSGGFRSPAPPRPEPTEAFRPPEPSGGFPAPEHSRGYPGPEPSGDFRRPDAPGYPPPQHPSGGFPRSDVHEPSGGFRAPEESPFAAEPTRYGPDAPARSRLRIPGKELVRSRLDRRKGEDEEGGRAKFFIITGAVALVVLILIVWGVVSLFSEDEPADTAGNTPNGGAQCAVTAQGTGCVPKPTCFNDFAIADSGAASATEAACTAEHAWEAYATGKLPDNLSAPVYKDVAAVDFIQKACRTKDVLKEFVPAAELDDWTTDVLPPSTQAFEGGDKTFYCIARKPDQTLTAPTLVK